MFQAIAGALYTLETMGKIVEAATDPNKADDLIPGMVASGAATAAALNHLGFPKGKLSRQSILKSGVLNPLNT